MADWNSAIVRGGSPRFARWRKKVVTDARSGEELTTGYGRLLANPDPDEAYKAVNWIVQGTAADTRPETVARSAVASLNLGTTRGRGRP